MYCWFSKANKFKPKMFVSWCWRSILTRDGNCNPILSLSLKVWIKCWCLGLHLWIMQVIWVKFIKESWCHFIHFNYCNDQFPMEQSIFFTQCMIIQAKIGPNYGPRRSWCFHNPMLSILFKIITKILTEWLQDMNFWLFIFIFMEVLLIW